MNFDYGKMKYIQVEIKPDPKIGNREALTADVEEGKVIACTPISLAEMNQDIDGCIKFLTKVKEVKDG